MASRTGEANAAHQSAAVWWQHQAVSDTLSCDHLSPIKVEDKSQNLTFTLTCNDLVLDAIVATIFKPFVTIDLKMSICSFATLSTSIHFCADR